MSATLLDESTTRPSSTPAQRLRSTTAAVRLSFTWFGVRKSLTAEQKAQAADTFGADGDCADSPDDRLAEQSPTA